MTTITTPALPVKDERLDWDAFTEELNQASEECAALLTELMPTPEITAELGTQEWSNEWFAQRAAADKRSRELMKYNARLVVEVGKAIAAITPNFRSLDVSYEGSGDDGEISDITVYLDRPALYDADGNRRPYTHEENQVENAKSDAANECLTKKLRSWLDETCWSIAYEQHPGFEIDAGGFGNLRVEPEDEDVEGSKLVLRISHTERVESVLDPVELA